MNLIETKKERERLAVEAAERRQFHDAFVYAAETARLGFRLAEQAEGAMARAHLDEANRWANLTERLKGRKNEADVAASETNATATGRGNSPWKIKERPTERFSDVAGLEEVKKIIFDDMINPMKYADYYRKMDVESGGGALMIGPPGSGKTLVAQATAGELDADFFVISGALIKDKYVGDTEKNVRKLFEEIAESPRAVLFIDEVECLLPKRDGGEKTAAIAVSEFLVMLDGFEKRKNSLLLLGATNNPEMIDPAALRRFKKLVNIGMPDVAARRQILEQQFKGVPSREPLDLDLYAAKTEGFSGADVVEFAKAAKKTAIRRKIEDGAEELELVPSDLESAISVTKPTVSPDTIEKYRKWEADFNGDGASKGSDEAPVEDDNR